MPSPSSLSLSRCHQNVSTQISARPQPKQASTGLSAQGRTHPGDLLYKPCPSCHLSVAFRFPQARRAAEDSSRLPEEEDAVCQVRHTRRGGSPPPAPAHVHCAASWPPSTPRTSEPSHNRHPGMAGKCSARTHVLCSATASGREGHRLKWKRNLSDKVT